MSEGSKKKRQLPPEAFDPDCGIDHTAQRKTPPGFDERMADLVKSLRQPAEKSDDRGDA